MNAPIARATSIKVLVRFLTRLIADFVLGIFVEYIYKRNHVVNFIIFDTFYSKMLPDYQS